MGLDRQQEENRDGEKKTRNEKGESDKQKWGEERREREDEEEKGEE